MWPTDTLAEMFKEARFGPFDIGGYEEREVIVRIAMDLGIKNEEFQTIYTKGVDRADALRKAKGLD